MRIWRLVLAVPCCAGCGTLATLWNEEGYPNQIYAGTRWSFNNPHMVLDTPFSLVADTLILPYTIPRTIHNAPNIPVPVVRDAWSKPVAGLAGRVRAASESIGPAEAFELTLELRNENREPLAIQAGNPFAFAARVRDGAGELVAPFLCRRDVLSTPRWLVLSPGGEASFPVTAGGGGAAKGAQLDAGTDVWALPAGRYRLDFVYSSEPFGGPAGKPESVASWKGALALPPIALEVREEPEAAPPPGDPSGGIYR